MPTLTDAVIIGAVPGLVEIAKRAGLPSRYAGICAVLTATVLLALQDLSGSGGQLGHIAAWLGGGVIAGLAASGLYSQARALGEKAPE
jgi:hypothetical protein